jgi:hypothetical protein
MDVRYINSKNNESDICTKNVSKGLHEAHRAHIRNGILASINIDQFRVVRREDVEKIQTIKTDENVEVNSNDIRSDLQYEFAEKYKVHLTTTDGDY